MNYVKYGVIGSGMAWTIHLTGLREIPTIKLKSMYDIKNAKLTARANNMDFYDNFDEFLKSDIDAVMILTPHYLHEKYVLAVAEAGKHILLEKPMATTLEGCDQMIEATRKAGVKFMIAENHRFLPAHEYIMKVVQSGLIGKPFLVRAYEGVNEIDGLMKEGFWKGHPIMAGGGALMDMGAHKFVTLNWILNDKVESASSWITRQCTNLDEKAEDNAMVFLQYEKGTIANIVVSFSVISPYSNNLEIYGTMGTIVENHDWQNPIRIFTKHEDMEDKRDTWFEPEIEHGPFPEYYKISMRNEDTYFTNCILHDSDPEFTPEEAKEAICTVLLSYLSAKFERTASRKELMEIYSTKGTKSILEGLEKIVKDNFSLSS
jgi:predicted dehydrogenase